MSCCSLLQPVAALAALSSFDDVVGDVEAPPPEPRTPPPGPQVEICTRDGIAVSHADDTATGGLLSAAAVPGRGAVDRDDAAGRAAASVAQTMRRSRFQRVGAVGVG